ncbi:MAG TPA: methyltransferase [Chryseolinea sp.]|nr:methyltransferase [Chryseolinea sp.]
MIKKAIVVLLGTGGIVLANMTIARWLSLILSSIVVYFLFLNPSFELGLTYWAVSMVVHYTVLFGTFIKGGFKEYWLKTSPTKEEAHKKFEAWLSFAFFHNGLAFSYLYFTTMNRDDFAFMPVTWVLWLGITLQVIGFIIKFLASWQIGLGIYYYKDMFIEEKVIDFEAKGIFRFMSNPLYGWGQLNGHGAALYAFSWIGIVAVAINQVCFYAFYYMLEKPFVQRFYLGQDKEGTGKVLKRQTPIGVPVEEEVEL